MKWERHEDVTDDPKTLLLNTAPIIALKITTQNSYPKGGLNFIFLMSHVILVVFLLKQP